MTTQGSDPEQRSRAANFIRIAGPVVGLAIALLVALGVASGPAVTIFGIGAALCGLVAAFFDAHQQSKGAKRGPARLVVSITLAGLTLVALVLVGFLSSPTRGNGDVERLSGGCPPYVIYAQNRWEPYGAKRLATPYRDAKQLTPGVAPNELIYVDGWVHTESAQPSNVAPWDSNIWFHLADGSGWVSFAGTRAVPTPQDPTGLDPNGGTPAPTPAECEAGLS